MQLLEKKLPHHIGLIGHTIINYPNAIEARKIVNILVDNNVALIELQIPFSEPIADGPLFTKANYEAISNGVTLLDCYQFMAEVSALYPIPFVFMTYANIVYKQGFELFVKKAKAAGAKGAIIPDLPLDIANDYLVACHKYDFTPIPVVSPNVSKTRLATISPYFDGFIYAVARAGVTGSKTMLDESTLQYLNDLKSYSDLPIAVGFGISSGKDLDYLRGTADYAVIGTETLRAYNKQGLSAVKKLWQELNHSRELLC